MPRNLLPRQRKDVQSGRPELDRDFDEEPAQPPVPPTAVTVPAGQILQDSMPFCERVTLTPDSKIKDLRRGCKWVFLSLGQRQK